MRDICYVYNEFKHIYKRNLYLKEEIIELVLAKLLQIISKKPSALFLIFKVRPLDNFSRQKITCSLICAIIK